VQKSLIFFINCYQNIFILTRTAATVIVAAMAASMFVLARVFGTDKAYPAHTHSGELTQNAGTNDADPNT
jgi:hypothetical protein